MNPFPDLEVIDLILSLGGDNGLYVFGTLGFLKALEKLGLEFEKFRCCGFSCIPLALSLLYSNNRAYNLLVRRESLMRKIFGWVYQEGYNAFRAMDVLKIMASVEIKRIPLLHRDRISSFVDDLFPNIDLSYLGNLEVAVLNVRVGEEEILKGDFSLRKSLKATLRFTPTSEPFEDIYVSCAGAVGIPEGDVVLDLDFEKDIPSPKRAIEIIAVAFHARREKIKDIRSEKALKAVRLRFGYFPRNLELFNTVYRESVKILSDGVEEKAG